MFPIMVDLSDKKIVVAGGGHVAYHKIQHLLKYDVHVHVVSPTFHHGIVALAKEKKVTLIQKSIEYEDYKDAFFVIAATDSKIVNNQIANLARPQQLVVNTTDPQNGNCTIPASFNRGKLVIGVSTGGASPTLAKEIRNQLAGQYDERYESYLDFLYEIREIIKHHISDPKEKRKWLKKAVDPIYLSSIEEQQQFMDQLQTVLNNELS
ncbi:MAG: NAD(P)-binding protein [Bacillales bacterium]|nr:NAD(P)-binding protein [Bacillales bacterium]